MKQLHKFKGAGFLAIYDLIGQYFDHISDTECELYLVELKKSGYAEVETNGNSQTVAKITFEGIKFCETSSFAQPGQPIIKIEE